MLRTAGVLLLFLPFGARAQQSTRVASDRELCIVDSATGALRDVRVRIDAAAGDTIDLQTGRSIRELTAASRYAGRAEWYGPERPVVIGGETYVPTADRMMPSRALRPFSFYRSVPVFVGGDSVRSGSSAENGTGEVRTPPPPAVVYLALQPGCSFRRYRQRTAELTPRLRPGELPTFTNVRIFYGTNRRATTDTRAAHRYGTESGPMELGELTVSVPAHHTPGQVEHPKWYRGEFSESETRHFILRVVTPLGAESTFSRIHGAVDSAKTHSVFVFVHGFKNSFSDAAYRTAQLAYDMSSDEVPVMYSWPSQGSITGYRADERAAAASVDSLEAFLTKLAATSGAHEIHLIAHSMGTRVLTSALRSIAERGGRRLFAQVVLAAPDIGASAFDSTLIARVRSTLTDSARVTVYASSSDWALRASQLIHKERRVGQTGPEPTVIDGVDTIDATETSTDFIGHAYYARQGVIGDLVKILINHLDPKGRRLIEQPPVHRLPYWLLLNQTSP